MSPQPPRAPHRLMSVAGARASRHHKRHSLVIAARRFTGPQVRSPPPLTSDVGHIQLLQDLFVWLSPRITPLSTQHQQRGVVSKAAVPRRTISLSLFFSSRQQSRRSRSIVLKDTRSCRLFMWVCRRQSSVSRKKLRNCPVFHPPDWTIRGRLMETNSVLSNLCGGQRDPSGGLRVIRVGTVTSPCSSDWLRGAFTAHCSRVLSAVMLAGGVSKERVVCRHVSAGRAATVRPVGRHNAATWQLLMIM